MKKSLTAIVGAGLGAAAMYWFDPQRGAARRTELKNHLQHYRNNAVHAVSGVAKDAQQRALGIAHETMSTLSFAKVSDAQLAERARAAIGHMVAHPGAIQLNVINGRLILRGPILADEVDWLIARLWSLRGVTAVENQLEPHNEAANVPALQGRLKATQHSGAHATDWSFAQRVAGGLGGGAMAAFGFRRAGWVSKFVALSGAALFLRAASNMELRHVTGVGRHGVHVKKNIAIDAPVERVYALWADCENLPQFMSHVRNVKKLSDRRWRWVVDGPAGTPVEFESITTSAKPYRRLAWKTVAGSLVQHAGTVRFEPRPDRSTAVYVSMNYKPVAGSVGHVIAKMLGVDPKKQMDDDLMRMKTFIETGHRPADAGATRSTPSLA